MIEARSTWISRAWTRSPMALRLVAAIVAVLGIGYLTAPTAPPTTYRAMVTAVVPAPARDPSVPDAGQVLPADDGQQEASIPTF